MTHVIVEQFSSSARPVRASRAQDEAPINATAARLGLPFVVLHGER